LNGERVAVESLEYGGGEMIGVAVEVKVDIDIKVAG
jgi:hypothetical protein